MKKHLLLFVLATVFLFSAVAESPKRELRATWLTSVSNIDWPKSTETAAQQKTSLVTILDGMQAARMNVVLLQVRPMCDALYQSAYEPWSQYLTGTRGKDPGYDPLAFAIDEAHKRGMELYAWINPYRYESVKNMHGANDPIRKNHPEWLLEYSSSYILDPGNPEVAAYLVNVLQDIITHYNVDGLIFDDYFYPYEGTTNEDAYSQSLYKPAGKSVDDWRRESVNKLIADIYSMIQETKPTVKFGIGPFGIWGGPQSAATAYGIDYLNTSGGTSAYSQLYCDGVAWLKEKSIDFISPQCYWPSFNTKAWGYKTLVPWWAGVAEVMGRHFYSSMRISTMPQSAPQRRNILQRLRITESEYDNLSMVERSVAATAAQGTEECGFEVDMNRSTDLLGAPGHVFFNTTQFFSYGLADYLAEEKFTQPALTPLMSWKTPQTLPHITDITLSGNTLSWQAPGADETIRYAIYYVPSRVVNSPATYEKSTYLRQITWETSVDVSSCTQSGYYFVVTAIDAAGNESEPYVKTPSGIQAGLAESLAVYGAQGAVCVSAPEATVVRVYAVTGQLVCEAEVERGTTEIPLPAGLYIVNGQKAVVR